VLIAQAGLEGGEVAVIPWLNTELNIKVAKPQIFNGESEKASKFLIAYKLYIRLRMRNIVVEEQV